MMKGSARRLRYLLAIATVLVVVAGAYLLGHANRSADAGAASPTTSTPVKLSAFYLDIGASESLGYQPTGIPGHNGERTNTGYANDLVQREALKGVALTLEQIGCPGDTIQSLLDTSKSDACYQAPETQLTKAEAYLQAHSTDQVLVTIDLGFNNVRPCMEQDPVNQTCLEQAYSIAYTRAPTYLSLTSRGCFRPTTTLLSTSPTWEPSRPTLHRHVSSRGSATRLRLGPMITPTTRATRSSPKPSRRCCHTRGPERRLRGAPAFHLGPASIPSVASSVFS